MKHRKITKPIHKYLPADTSIVIIRDDEKIGHIKCTEEGYQYKFNGSDIKSEVLPSLEACKKEIES